MASTAQSIITRATQVAKCPNYTTQALLYLNAILSDLCDYDDFALARGEFNFTFNVNLVSTGGGNIVTSGPNKLPMDYLRTSGSSGSSGTGKSSIWYLQGVPYPMIPCDLAEFDVQVQQAGIQSYPWLWATDMAVAEVSRETAGDLVAGSTTVNRLFATDGIVPGQSVSGNGIVPGTTITGLVGITCTLSQPALVTRPGVVLVFGTPPVGFAYPPPSGAYNCMIRYQRRMPNMTQSQVVAGAYPWFPNDGYLVDELAGRLMQITDDSRVTQQLTLAEKRLGAYMAQKDDEANRSHTVQLDRRAFGPNFANARNTKLIGW